MRQVVGEFRSGGIDLQLASLRDAYASRTLAPRDVINAVCERTASFEHKNIWLHFAARHELLEQLERAQRRLGQGESLPLFGVPFAVADNLDVALMPTTLGHSGCKDRLATTCPAVQRLLDMGAICMGKTNLDRLGFGWSGVTGAAGICSSAFDDERIAGGASAGAALAVALGLVSFAIATDCAGDTLVPAALNGVIGLRIANDAVSRRGVRMGAPSIEAMGVFAGNASDAQTLTTLISEPDTRHASALAVSSDRLPGRSVLIGVPDGALEFEGDTLAMRLFDHTCARVAELEWSKVSVSLEHVYEVVGHELYQLIAAEYEATFGSLLSDEGQSKAMETIRASTAWTGMSAVSAFQKMHHLRAAADVLRELWSRMDALLLPTVPTTFRLDELPTDDATGWLRMRRYAALPGALNLTAVSIPVGFKTPAMPFGVMLVAPAGEEANVLRLAGQLHASLNLRVGATRVGVRHDPSDSEQPQTDVSLERDEFCVDIAVVGTHLQGQVHHHQLVALGARFIRATRTTASYELFLFTDRGTEQPALVRRSQPSGSVRVEVYRLHAADFGKLVAGVTSSQSVSEIELEDGTWVKGFLCEPGALAGARDITKFGGWVEYQNARARAWSLRTAAMEPAQ